MKLPLVADHTGEPDPVRPANQHNGQRSQHGDGEQRREQNGPQRKPNGNRGQQHRQKQGGQKRGEDRHGQPAHGHHHARKEHGGQHQHRHAEARDGSQPRQRSNEKGSFAGLPGSGAHNAGAPNGERKPFRGKRRFGGKRPAFRAA
jgi:hypothetical protein